MARPDSIDSLMKLEDAVNRILGCLPPPVTEVLPLARAAGRFLAADVISTRAVPAFDNTAMDGYAVRSSDVAAASPSAPVTLRVIGRTAAGEVFHGSVAAGAAVRVFTGSPMPEGADAVVMQEDTRRAVAGHEWVDIVDPAPPGQFVRAKGSDIQPGLRVCGVGDRLTPGRLGLIASLGLGEVTVGRKPSVALLGTGSELVEPGQRMEEGQIFESNRVMLAAWAEEAGARVTVLPLVQDTLDATRAALASALEAHDAVITTGGVSVGETDFVKPAFEAIGGTLDLWKVAVKPGKPFAFGRLDNRFLFGLPGNPASAAVTFLLLVRPALIRMQGGPATSLPVHPARLAEAIANPGDRRHFVRVSVDADGRVRPAGPQGSHAMTSLAQANGLVDVPPGTTLAMGEPVVVLRIG